MPSTTDIQSVPDLRRVKRAVIASYVTFGGAGFAIASWASRIPQVRDRLHLEPSELGLVLLAVAVGSLLALPLSGPVIARFGSRRTVTVTAAMLGVALLTVAFGYRIGVAPVVVGLFLFGLRRGPGRGDQRPRRLRRAATRSIDHVPIPRRLQPRTVTGALVGAAMVAGGVSVTVHLVVAALVVSPSVIVAATRFLPEHDHDHSAVITNDSSNAAAEPSIPEIARRGHVRGLARASHPPHRRLRARVRFAEGVANDWIAVAVIDDHHASEAVGTLAFAVFLASMTVARWFGPALLDRHGRVAVSRTIAVVGYRRDDAVRAGTSHVVGARRSGTVGPGASLGFPVGMSAGADEPALAASRVSVISSIGYYAFLTGPPLIGFLGDQVTVLRALVSVTVLLALAAVIAPVVQPPPVE